MTPSTSHTPSTVEASPFRSHSMRSRRSMLPPKKSPERKMGIRRADSGIAILSDTNNAIPDTEQISGQSSVLKEDLLDAIPTDISESTSTFNINKIINTISKLVELTDHFRAIFTPLPTTPIAHLDGFLTTDELSTEGTTPYTFAGKKEQEEAPSGTSTSTDTSGSTLADDMNGTISKINQILDQISIARHYTSIMSPSLNDFYLIDPIIPQRNLEKGKGRQKEEQEQTPLQPIPPTTNSSNPDLPTPIFLPPFSTAESEKRIRRRAQYCRRTSKPALSPTPLHIRRQNPLPKSTVGVENETPITPTSEVLEPYHWMLRDTNLFARAMDSQTPSDSHLRTLQTLPPNPNPNSNTKRIFDRSQEQEEAILTEPYDEPSMSKPASLRPWRNSLADLFRDGEKSRILILPLPMPMPMSILYYRALMERVLLCILGRRARKRRRGRGRRRTSRPSRTGTKSTTKPKKERKTFHKAAHRNQKSGRE